MNGKKISLAILLIGLGVYQLWGVSQVSFHPDESTQLYMSADFERFFFMTPSLYWNPEKDNLAQHYRLVDAPLTKYILGIGRNVAGLPPLRADWDWSKSWQENEAAGALPSDDLLFAGRLAVTLLLPLSMLLLYLAGKQLGGAATGLLGVLLIGTNALILLHGRRAMAEGVLTFGVALAIWGILQGDRHPWLAGMGIAIACSAKQSALALVPVGFLAVMWFRPGLYKDLRRLITNSLIYIGAFALLTLALNPFLWSDPIGAFISSWNARQELVDRQVETTRAMAPNLVLSQPSQRAAAVLLNLYVREPSFAEFSNYAQYTASSERNYMAIPGHNILRGLLGGVFMYSLTLFGIVLGAIRIFKGPSIDRRNHAVMLLATISLALSLILFVPFPHQRYTIPLVPLTTVWIAYGIGHLLMQFFPSLHNQKERTRYNAPAPSSSD